MTCGGEGTGRLNEDLEFVRRKKIISALTGRKVSEKEKMNNCLSKRNRIPVIINGIEYPSLRKAALAFGVHRSTIKKLYYI